MTIPETYEPGIDPVEIKLAMRRMTLTDQVRDLPPDIQAPIWEEMYSRLEAGGYGDLRGSEAFAVNMEMNKIIIAALEEGLQ